MDYQIELRYQKLVAHLEKSLGPDLDVHALLFLIGVNELGIGHKRYSKQEKTDLIHVAICTLLVPAGYYEFKGRDEDGWPHFELLKNLPAINSKDQEHLIKEAMLDYFLEHQYYDEIKDLVSD
ncbi:MAG: hypothetical protein P8P80_04280 [Crocinitomicaceae bacterium]|jgi:hypothetical protein|nr:hypothetical protein [Crocinitomicaceae bacterium]MDG1734480.1 hypothetical protein [Crocinitomicaceae bacterium]MDG2505301.1 hypothetical protein [Crocinitomicaceae bacterium]